MVKKQKSMGKESVVAGSAEEILIWVIDVDARPGNFTMKARVGGAPEKRLELGQDRGERVAKRETQHGLERSQKGLARSSSDQEE